MLNNLKTALHWLFQVLPPLFIVTGIPYGGAINTIVVIYWLASIISVISILSKLFKFKSKKKYILRPVLTVIVTIVITIVGESTYSIAFQKTHLLGLEIEERCIKNSSCPTKNEVQSMGRYQEITKLDQITYHLSYSHKSDMKTFNLYISKAFDNGAYFIGGTKGELRNAEEIPSGYNQ